MNFTEIASKLESVLYGHASAAGAGASKERGLRVDLDAASSTHAALLISCLLSKAGSQERVDGGPLFWISPDKASAEARARELELLSGRPVHLFPAWSELLFMPLIPSRDLISQRISALHAAMNSGQALIVTWAEALLEPLVPPEILASAVETISTGDEIGRDILADWLVDAGYEPCRLVTRVGEFAVRGGIVDLFSPGQDYPVRLDFLGDEVETIRYFDPDTQRSMGRLDRVRLLPMTDFILSAKSADEAIGRLIEEAGGLGLSASAVTETMQLIKERRTYEMHLALLPLIYSPAARLSDYMEGSLAVVMERPGEILRNLEEASKAAETSWRQELERERIFAGFDRYILPLSDLKAGLGPRRKVLVWAGDIYREAGIEAIVHEEALVEFRLPVESCRVPSLGLSFKRGRELFAPVVELLQKWSGEDGGQVVLLASDREQERRISSLLSHYGIEPEAYRPGDGSGLCRLAIQERGEGPPPSGIVLSRGWLKDSVLLHRGEEGGRLILLPDHLIFDIPERRTRGRRTKAGGRQRGETVSLSDLRQGDFVVHRDHGIAQYQGLLPMEVGGIAGEFFVLEYAGGDKLYLPVDRISLLTPYVGAEGRQPRLDKLGGKSWQVRKGKVQKALKEIAHDLVELYAQRRLLKGIAFSPPDEMFRQFEMDFPFEETPDQAKAISEILEDMQADSPMDRLLCGDVGYGKTEVAMRAAFKAVQDGWQVAVLVPTTLLAEQHERTFRKRFRRFPVRIESLSRMKPPRVQKSIVQAVKEGRVDILIGTHKLLSAAHMFKRLGLVIIDEEHRFGVRHKERLKKLAQQVDCLTLTATPIPRTLQLSLLGLRDLSTIETAPEGRMGVKCFLAEADDAIIKNAIVKEMERGGQVFFVHNRVAGLSRLSDKVKALVPEARVAMAHGQMEPAQLEQVMIDFVRGEIDCLVSTTIIESGLDIPSANTLIVNRADMLGLADLYQLRGRVGRSSLQAYAYFLVPHLPSLGKDAVKRLRAFMQAAEHGGGMGLAMQDLKIRGGGNLLGLIQAGRVADIGYDLYLELLSDAVRELKGQPLEPKTDPEVNLRLPAFIPEHYIPDISMRVETYRHLAKMAEEGMVLEAALDLEDRFGPMPEEVRNLLSVLEIKELLRQMNVVRLDRAGVSKKGRVRFVLSFAAQGPANPDALLALAAKDGRISFLPDSRMVFEIKGPESEPFPMLLKGLKELIEITK